MDTKARKAPIDSLADASYNEANRRCMVGKLIAVHEGRGETDAAIKSKTTDAATRANPQVTKHVISRI